MGTGLYETVLLTIYFMKLNGILSYVDLIIVYEFSFMPTISGRQRRFRFRSILPGMVINPKLFEISYQLKLIFLAEMQLLYVVTFSHLY